MTVDEALLRERLLTRKRESPEQIEQRIARNREFSALMKADDALIHNDTSIEDMLAQFIEIRQSF